MKILLAEDERDLNRALAQIFTKNNYSVDAVYDGAEALSYLTEGDYDCAVLDVMMPKMDGITVLKTIRKAGNNLPVLILTAKSELDDRILGLDSGADDYLTKPFEMKELLARVRAITRRLTGGADTDLTFGNCTLSRTTYILSTPEGSVRLANKEFQMLEMLMSASRQVISPERFMEKIWGFDSESDVSVVWVYITYLRKKLTAVKANVSIKAMRNAGYTLETI
ncbi:MAG: response regulator transcription factor [Clostridia bacterium]|nr:response regulator transcription factor [Clostridia bacterium]